VQTNTRASGNGIICIGNADLHCAHAAASTLSTSIAGSVGVVKGLG
jgi:hypothetical protein